MQGLGIEKVEDHCASMLIKAPALKISKLAKIRKPKVVFTFIPVFPAYWRNQLIPS